jgi:hypothetical protein
VAAGRGFFACSKGHHGRVEEGEKGVMGMKFRCSSVPGTFVS